MSFSISRKFFTKHFPPPKFLEMPTVGLDLTDNVVRFVELRRHGTHYEVKQYGEKQIPHGVIDDGYINDKVELVRILSDIQNEYGLRFIVASLPEDKSYLFTTKIPIMAERDIRNALQFKIEENVPIALADAIFDFKSLTIPKPGDTEIEVAVTVIHTKVVTSYLEVLHQSGLIPLRLLTESHAIPPVIISDGDTDTCIIAAFRPTKTIFMIVSNGIIQFTTSTSTAGRSMDEEFKKEIHAEIQKLFSYWVNKGTGIPISHILLTGSAALLDMDAYLGRMFTVPVAVADAWKNITSLNEYVPELTRQESLDFIPALGLAMSHD
ncbi:pilus assembly protein PilM [Candidatus Parcubacteria bacterium]|nr:pilus assembly protein PilM [Candidatus Parcubacteria bacterium]